ncbi:pilus assembly FimT family protein [Flexistipes sinusarabici]|uniref:pilus assembly FimT family protein n=1 Tax=Flexistipes sinusarabici TaxID=2352 RepID=UPI002354DD5E|nr:type II secretion system protein [Flexistipes sinusarabici]
MHKAFTLIELLVVIAIVGIILGISTLYFPKMISKIHVNETADRIVTMLETAMQNSITKGYENAPGSPAYKLYGLSLDNSSSPLVIRSCTFEGDSPDNLTMKNCENYTLPDDLKVTYDDNQVVFNKRGISTDITTITLENSFGYKKEISVTGAKINVE